MYVSYLSGAFDFTGTQMVLTMKLTSFAYNLFDGTADRDKVFKDYDANDKKGKIYADRRKYAIKQIPNLLEFFGYVFCFPCILAGPAFEYQDYIRAINGEKSSLTVTLLNGNLLLRSSQ
jgi:D-alanyl-lipoteichoic acid acyltransferase DltB (MBOAT superfamily)